MRAKGFGIAWLVATGLAACAQPAPRVAAASAAKDEPAIPATYDARYPSARCGACHAKPLADLAATWSRHKPIGCAVCHRVDHGATAQCAFCHRAPHREDQGSGCGDCHGKAHALEKM